ncbi:hypothetical protein CGRA01v4_10575 [Colletotrichum graminicola]|nr:hypothetical protein CGRA01v4_10575 [Colletotrichum graminicola]
MCMVFERVRSIKKRIREGKHIRIWSPAATESCFLFSFSRRGGLPRLTTRK